MKDRNWRIGVKVRPDLDGVDEAKVGGTGVLDLANGSFETGEGVLEAGAELMAAASR